MIYHSLVASCIDYGILIWASEFSKNLPGDFPFDHVPSTLKCLNSAHNKTIRAFTCSRKCVDINSLYKDLHVLKLCDKYYLQLALFAFDCIALEKHPEVFTNYIPLAHHTKNHGKLESLRTTDYHMTHIPKVKLKSTYKTIRFASSRLWNIIPAPLRITSCSRNTFKTKISSWLLSKY